MSLVPLNETETRIQSERWIHNEIIRHFGSCAIPTPFGETLLALSRPLHAKLFETSIDRCTTETVCEFRAVSVVECTVALSDDVETIRQNTVEFLIRHTGSKAREVTVPRVRCVGHVYYYW